MSTQLVPLDIIEDRAIEQQIADGDLRYCNCADPEACREPIPGYACRPRRAEVVPVIDGELVDVDQSLVPFVSKMDELQAMVRKYTAYADTAAVQLVIGDDSKKQAASTVRHWKKERKVAEEFFKPMKQSIDAVKAKALAFERNTLALIDGPVAVVVGRIQAYDAAVAREAEQRRQRLIAAEAERIRTEQAAEQARAEEQAAIDAMLAAEFGTDEPQASVPVQSLTEAEILEQAAVDAPAVAEPEKVDGMHYTSVTNYVIHDREALISAILAGVVPRGAIDIDLGFVREQAVAMGEDLGWPGVTVTVSKAPRFR